MILRFREIFPAVVAEARHQNIQFMELCLVVSCLLLVINISLWYSLSVDNLWHLKVK